MNKSGGFQRLQQVFENYQPIEERGLINVPSDPRTNGTRQLYFAQRWGKNAIFINTDCRTYRDIRMKTVRQCRRHRPSRRQSKPHNAGCDAACVAGTNASRRAARPPTWKFINISDPIDEIGPIGGNLTLVNPPTDC